MKNLLILLSVLCTAVPYARGFFEKTKVGAYGSLIVPMSDDLEGGGAGLLVRGQVNDYVDLDFRTGYFEFINPVVADMIPVECNVLLKAAGETFSPYVGAGAGYYFFTNSGPNLESEAGFYGLAGLEANFGNWMIFAEFRYQFLETNVESSQSFSGYSKGDEIDLSGTVLGGGITYRF